jgi:hypothetical protein
MVYFLLYSFFIYFQKSGEIGEDGKDYPIPLAGLHVREVNYKNLSCPCD